MSLSYRGKNLLSLIDPIAQAERLADAAPKQARTLYFCPSPLYGYGLERLLSQIPEDSSVIAVETDEALMALSRESLPRPLLDHPRFRVVRTTDPASLCAFVRGVWGSRRFRRLTVVRLSGGWQTGGPCYETLADALGEDIARDWENALTLTRLGRRYMANAIRNLPLLARGAGSAESPCFGEAPVLVLGAGPSLDSLLDTFAAKSGRAGVLFRSEERPFRIVCVDTALKNLYARGIKPDLAVALESQHWNLRDFTGLGGWKVPLAMDLSALPAAGETLGGDVRLFFTPWTAIRLFKRLEAEGFLPPEMPPLGSVGLFAAALALRISSGPTLTGALDFSFTIDRFHARSTPGHLESLRLSTRLRPLVRGTAFRAGVSAAVGKNGEPVLTDPALKRYRRLFEREFGRGAPGNPGGRLRDIAGSGLNLGVETLPPDAALELLLAGPGTGGAEKTAVSGARPGGDTARTAPERMESFLRRERETLAELRGILTGRAGSGRLETLLDECDYLWAHFPDC
ncbi:MAG: DUF115 domain-containing protein, partial [Treponema sp.]|nr:DUF115 domain-containing protein [Treponema sp.]